MYHIVGYSDWNTCSTGGDWTEAWTDSDGVVDWSPTIILWGLPLYCEGHTVPTILLNSGGGSPGRRGETCTGRKSSISDAKFNNVLLKHCPRTLYSMQHTPDGVKQRTVNSACVV